MPQATTAQLNTAANRLAQTNSAYRNMSAQQILDAAKRDNQLAGRLSELLPRGVTFGATTGGATFTLPQANQAAQAGTRDVRAPDGTVYYLVPPSTTKGATWVAQKPGQTNYLPVNLDNSGRPSIGSGVAYSTKNQFEMAVSLAEKSTAQAQAKETAARATAAENTAKINSLVKDFNNLISNNRVTAQDIDSYQSQLKSLGASLPGGLVSQANNQLAAAQKAEADRVAAQKAAEEKAAAQAAAQKAAEEKAAAQAAAQKAAEEKAAAQRAEAERAAQNQARLQQASTELSQAVAAGQVTQALLDQYQSAVTAAGGRRDNALLSQAQGQINQKISQFANEITRASNAGTLTKQQVQDIAERASAAGVPYSQAQLAQLNDTAQTFLNRQFDARLTGAMSQQELDQVLAEAKAAGATPNARSVEIAQTGITNRIAQQEQARQQQRQTDLETRLTQAATQQDFDQVLAQAQADRINLDPGQIARSRQALDNRIQQQQQEAAAKAQAPYIEQLRVAMGAGDAAAFDQILEQAQAQGVSLADATVQPLRANLETNQRIRNDQRLQALTSQFNQQLEQVQSTADIDRIRNQAQEQGLKPEALNLDRANRLVAQLDETYAEVAKTIQDDFQGNRFTASGMEVMRMPDDPVTGAKGGYYIPSGNGVRAVGPDGRPTGDVVSIDQFNQASAQARQNAANFSRDQNTAQQAAQLRDQVARFEATLPQPGSEQFQYLLANRFTLEGPDGRVYELVDRNEKTGDAAHWIVSVNPGANISDPATNYRRLDNPDAMVQKGAVNDLFVTNRDVRNARQLEQRAALAAEQRRERDGDVGAMTRFILGTLAVAGGALLLANYGPALYDKIVNGIATLAEGGASAGEIAEVMTNIYDLPTELASNLGEIATGAVDDALATIPGVTPPPSYGLPPGLTESEIIPGFGGVAPPPAPIVPGVPGPESVFEYGFPEAPVAGPVSPPTPTLPGPENVFEYGFPETPALPPGAELPPAIEYPGAPAPSTPPVEVAAGPGPVTDVPIGEPPLRIDITGLPEPTTPVDVINYPDLGPPDFIYEPPVEAPAFGTPGAAPATPGIPTEPVIPGPENVFEYGFPEAPVVAPPPAPPAPPATPGPGNVFEFGYPEVPVPPITPPAGPGVTAPPGPGNVFEFGYPEVPVPPITPPSPPEINYPDLGPPDYVYQPTPPSPPEINYPNPEPPDYVYEPTPPRNIIDIIRDLPMPPFIPIIPITPSPPSPPEYGPLGPIDFGQAGRVNLPGVNPGFFTQPRPFYQTTSPVQSQYSWYQRPLQTGTEYSAEAYNAPEYGAAQPFGLRQMYTPMDIQQYITALNPGLATPARR